MDAAKIKSLREKAGLTQEQAAQRAGFSGRQAWNNIESGSRDIRVTTLDKVAKVLGVKARDLLK